MSKFKIGDSVRVISRTCRYFDAVGTIEAIDATNIGLEFHVAGLEDVPLWFGPHELILAEHETREEL